MNPITEARISAGLSKQKFASDLRLSRTFILRAEEGCYSNPGNKLVDFTTKQLKLSRTEFMKRYAKFQTEVRERSAQLLEPLQILNRAAVVTSCPVGSVKEISSEDDHGIVYTHEVFKKWREGYWNSYISFSRSLCVHPASAENYERGDYDEMPILMEEALREVKLIDESFDPKLRWCHVNL